MSYSTPAYFKTFSRRVASVAAWVAISVWCLLALIFFSPHDHAWFFQDSLVAHAGIFADSAFVRASNFCVGAGIYFLGCSLWCLVPIFLCSAYQKIKGVRRGDFFARTTGLVLLAVTSAVFCAVTPYEFYAYVQPGGLVGNGLHALFMWAGCAEIEIIILVVCMLTAGMLIFGYAWTSTFYFFGVRCCRAVADSRGALKGREVFCLLKKKTLALLWDDADEVTCEEQCDKLERLVQEIVLGKKGNRPSRFFGDRDFPDA